MKRTFIAFNITPSPHTRVAYEEIRRHLTPEKIGWTNDTQFHITLKFLGDTPEETLPDIIQCLKSISDIYTPFNVSIKGLGVFRNLRDPRIIWMGCNVDEVLEAMHHEIEKNLVRFGFEAEHRRFAPHLTLGRIRQIREVNRLAEIITAYKNTEFQQQQVHEIIFYESRLLPSGAKYIPLEVFNL